MNPQQKSLAEDLTALRYIEAVNAGDLESVSDFWGEASHDANLEELFASIDGALFQEVQDNSGVRLKWRSARVRRWTSAIAAACALAAAGYLTIWVPWHRDVKKNASIPTAIRVIKPVNGTHVENHPDLSSLLAARREASEAEMPRFVWPVENRFSTSTPLDLLD
jgi:hypothetical protein